MNQEIKKYEVTPELLIDIYRNIPKQFVEAVVNYANIWNIDPHLKIYHIVEFKGKTGSTYSIMPSITLFRIQASRSGTYAGKSLPTYGPTMKIGETEYPEYCKMSVKKLVAGEVREFSHETRWLGCYAKKGAGSILPNDRWAQDPYGMIAKTTESQLLRIVWPEMTGSQPAYEEMEGKEHYIDGEVVEQVDKETGEIRLPKDDVGEEHNKLVSLISKLSEEDGAKIMQYYAKHDCTKEVALQLIERIETKLKEKENGTSTI